MNADWFERLVRHEAAYTGLIACSEQGASAVMFSNDRIPNWQDANHAFLLRDGGEGAEAGVAEIVEFYRSRGLRPIADVDDAAESAGFGRSLRRRGFEPAAQRHLLMLCEDPPPRNGDAQVRIIEPGDAAGNAAWLEIQLSENEPDWMQECQRVVADLELSSGRCARYLATVDDAPAAACLLFAAEGFARVESVVTAPRLRRRGAASALVSRVTADAADLGEPILYTEQGGAAERIYTRLGYRAVAINPFRRHMMPDRTGRAG